MARPLRIEYPGAVHHVTSRGNEGRPIFRTDDDREMFLSLLGQAVKRFGWSLGAYVLMTNHFHLLIQTPEPTLSRGMQWLNTTYVTWFNLRHHRSGHLFQGRFHSFLIEKASYFTEVLRYVVLNPVRAKMVATPEAYRWSSYRATAGLEDAPDWLDTEEALAVFGSTPLEASGAYQRYVLAKVGYDKSLWDAVSHGIFLGSEPWMVQMRKLVESKPRSNEHPRKQRAVGRPSMSKIVSALSAVTGLAVDEVRGKKARHIRDLVAWIGWNEGLAPLGVIAAALRLRSESYMSRLIRRCEQAFSSDGRLLTTLDQTLALLRT
jgi:putative transposase